MTLQSIQSAAERGSWPSSYEELTQRWNGLSPEEKQARRARLIAESDDEFRLKRLEHQRDLYRRLSEIDEKYRDCTLDNYEPRTPDQKRALAAAWRVVDDPDHVGLGLTGLWGQAKSILSASIVNTCNDRLIPAVFLTWVSLIDMLRETYDNDGRLRKGRREIIDGITAARVLVIDDIDKEPLTVDVARHLFRLLDRRDKRKRPLIVTANRTLADIGRAWKAAAGITNPQQRPDVETSGAVWRRLGELCGSADVHGFRGEWIHLEPHKGQV